VTRLKNKMASVVSCRLRHNSSFVVVRSFRIWRCDTTLCNLLQANCCYCSCTIIRQCWSACCRGWYGGLALIPRCGRESQQISADESRAYFWSRCDWNFFGLVRPYVLSSSFPVLCVPFCRFCSLLSRTPHDLPSASFVFIVFIKLSQYEIC
jgi:hypothetical protein